MTEDDRKQVYWNLLKGMAKTSQDRMCADDRQHDWGPWVRTMLRKEIPLPTCIYSDANSMNETFLTRSDRQCLNCGKEEMLK